MPGDLATLAARALDGAVPGAAVAVRHGSGTVLSACHGHADLEWQVPVTPDTVFRLASLSKPMTALTVVLLARDGALDLDAPVRAYLPDYPAHAAGVTVRHLLTHTSGIPNFVTDPDFAGTAARLDHTDAELRARFADRPLHWTPGARYGYSNSGYRLLDMVVSGVTGRPFAEVLADRVFAPAGMGDSTLLDDTTVVPRRAAGYQPGAAGGFANADYVSMTVPGGAGGIGSTLSDMCRFDRALFVDGTFGDVEEMLAPVRLTCGRSEGYGLGLASQAYRGRRVAHHAGGINGFSCLYLCLPDDGISAVLLTNLAGFPCGRAVRPLVDALLGAGPLVGTPAPDGPPDGARAGTYRDPVNTVEVTFEGDRLAVSWAGRTHRMARLSATGYADPEDAEVTLRFHDDGPVPACTLTVPFTWVTGYRDTP